MKATLTKSVKIELQFGTRAGVVKEAFTAALPCYAKATREHPLYRAALSAAIAPYTVKHGVAPCVSHYTTL